MVKFSVEEIINKDGVNPSMLLGHPGHGACIEVFACDTTELVHRVSLVLKALNGGSILTEDK